jgi:hypothetical protein
VTVGAANYAPLLLLFSSVKTRSSCDEHCFTAASIAASVDVPRLISYSPMARLLEERLTCDPSSWSS